MSAFFKIVIVLFVFNGMAFAKSSEVDSDRPNFMLGLGYGLLEGQSLLNIDLNVNIPIEKHISTQVLLNSNYLITGSETDSFAQSEFFSNWFVHNDYGRFGIGLGYSELEPLDESAAVESDVLGQYIAEIFLGDFRLGGNHISSDTTLSNITSSKVGVSYYLNDDQRISFYREKYSEESIGWRLETYFQPKKYARTASIGIIARTDDEYDYLGIIGRYYFDHAATLKDREMAFY